MNNQPGAHGTSHFEIR